ncbi:MAG: UDP-N-acetylmuramyl-tripeptide synthetase [Patescibacteria group bacterium]|nr:UDP-N-acetylmuramyl-tripeptide synthetase [Patescibacteria group bacterium]MDE1940499.1 UDP-N-acetylmuramyl-tripeptide synthetase [Patescibacteria group bacterium]MDE1966565.1 UDP-N-acetylmuramyl-tripeptide synthetase [Patescibacteria group bacterium]
MPYLRRTYHLFLAFAAAVVCRFPSRRIKVIAVTGTKGKSSTTELLNAILEEAGHKTALSNTIRFKIGGESEPNLYKMSMPGRGFLQRFLRRAVNAGCEYAVIEMTSQGALLFRHKFIELDGLIFTNLSPEHIEAHGSYENYLDSKLDIARQLAASRKNSRLLVVNADDPESGRFLAAAGPTEKKIGFSLEDSGPYEIKEEGLSFAWNGRPASSSLSGRFNLYNILAAATAAKALGIGDDAIVSAVSKFSYIPGRVQKVERGQGFEVVVDYAHTPDSLRQFYGVFKKSDPADGGPKNICVLGGTGGGRDSWKRAEMGRIADENCADIILTDEDPYDEDPKKIVEDVAKGVTRKKPAIIMDRREAIREAISRARPGDSVLITGKGTDPFIMGPHGTKTPWSDFRVTKEELEASLKRRNPGSRDTSPRQEIPGRRSA